MEDEDFDEWGMEGAASMGMREWLDEAWVAYGFWSLMNLQAYYVYYFKLVD